MTTLKHRITFFALLGTVLVGCQSTPTTHASKMGDEIPAWVTNPAAEKGLAASSCVSASNSFSLDKTQAAMLARQELASQLDTRISSMQQVFSEKLNSNAVNNTTVNFSEIAVQFTDQYLRGAKVAQVDYAQIGGIKQLCSLVSISEADTLRLVSELLKKVPTKLDPESESLMYLSFLKDQNKL